MERQRNEYKNNRIEPIWFDGTDYRVIIQAKQTIMANQTKRRKTAGGESTKRKQGLTGLTMLHNKIIHVDVVTLYSPPLVGALTQ